MKFSYLIVAFVSFLSFSAHSQGGIGGGSGCPTGYTEYFADNDGDGYGDPQNIVCLSGAQPGYTLNNGDCNDLNANINPDTLWYRDADGDGAGDMNDWKRQCLQPSGYVLDSSDCDDTNPSIISCPTETAVLPSNQSFESGFSPWIQDTADNLDWTRTSGTTPSSGTGPTAAFDGTYYIFTEASGNYSKTFNLISPLLSITSALDFSFNYHMYGSAMGSLTLYVSTNGGTSWQQLWSASGDKGTSWLSQTISLSSYLNSEIKLRFSGVTGTNYTSDMALDNFQFISQAPAPCAVVLSDENYVFKRVYKEGQTSPLTAPTKEQVIEEVTYFDGLGRPMQHVGIRQAGGTACEDIVTHIAYDQYGRENKKYLPHPEGTNIGKYRTSTTAISNTNDYYISNYSADFTPTIINPYSETLFEASPLNRPLQQGAPGAPWEVNSHSIKSGYQTNSASEVRLYSVSLSSAYVPTLVQSTTSYYGAGQLFKSITKDENWTSGVNNTTEEFKDKQGKVVLKRTYNAGTAHDTYYVYDDYGNLTYVVPPKVVTSDGISTTELAELCYQYRYDGRNRLIEKKIPGKGTATNWESIVYNKLDQPIMTQDPNLKALNKWLFTKYDAFGRVAYTGLVTRTVSRTTLQTEADNNTAQYENRGSALTLGGTTIYYTNNAYPKTYISEVHTENYYDTYLASSAQAGIVVPSSNSVGEIISTATKGLPTVSKVRVLDTSNWITTVTAYENKGRPVWTKSVNAFHSTTDLVESDLDFIGNVKINKTTHSKSGQTTITTVDTYLYDHVGRLLEQKQKVNSNPTELIARNTYDRLGQLIQKKVGGVDTGTGLQQVDYTYNVRGWLKQINNPTTLGTDLLAFKINYNTVDQGGTPLFNGNIAETKWRTANTDSNLKWYKYGYDHLNRITSAIDNTTDTRYSLTNVAYDKNGNITNLTRKGAINSTSSSFGNMDVLSYYYINSGNRLQRVNDSGYGTYGFINGVSLTTEYGYDGNANMLTDSNKGITGITYNHFNLPKSVSIGGGTISYIYDATGVKQRKVAAGTTTDYAGNYMYKNGTLQFFNHPEGYVENISGSFKYHYQYKDHLGNVRLTYADLNSNGTIDPSSEILDEKNYYPFGLEHQGYNSTVISENNFKTYNGKECEDLGLDMYEMDFRQYDPAIARFTSIDPVTHWSISTYSAFDNNPIFFADPSGASVIVSEDGNKITFTGEDAKNAFRAITGNSDSNNDSSNEKSDENGTSTDPLSSDNNMMKIADPEDDIREFEKNDRIITRNSIILDVLGKLTTTGQLKSTMKAVITEWEKSTREIITPYEQTQMLSDMNDALTALGITVTTAAPQVKIAATIIATPLMTENIYRTGMNDLVYGPRIKEHSPTEYTRLTGVQVYTPHTGGSFGGGGAGGSWNEN